MKKIQMVDLKSQYHAIKSEVDAAILNVIENTAFINGPEVKNFQAELEKYLGVKNVIACANGTDALQIAMMALNLKPGDEVITATFTYVATAEVIALLNLTPVLVDVYPDTFDIDIKALENAITPKTKVFMFSSPCNPSGAVYNKAELEALANLFKKYPQITILSDEIYEYINFIGKHESIAQFSEIKDQVIVINGLSKGFAMTGWRLGYTASNITLAKAMEKLQGQFTSGTSSITQKAAVAALVGDLKPSIAMTEEFTRRRTATLALVNAMPGFKCFAPEGAFYVFPDVSSYYGKSDGQQTIKNASDLSMFLLNTAHVSSVMGDAFGEPHCVRFSFANSMENIEKAWARIREALATLK